MIIKYYGGFTTIDTLSTLCKTTRSGTSAYYIIKAAEEVGLKAEGIKCNLEKLIQKEFHLPIIAHVLINKTYLHYVVIYEINKKRNYFVIADPAIGIKKMSFSNFDKIYNNTILTFIPKKELIKEEKNTNFYITFLSLLKKYKKECILLLLLSVLFTIFSIISTFYLSSITENIIYKSKSYLFSIFIIFSLFYLCKSISHFFRNLLLIYIHAKINFVLTEETFHQILSLPYSYYKNHTTGDIVSRINDLSIVKDATSKFFLFMCIDVCLSLISFICLYKIEKTISKIAILCMVCYIFIPCLFYKKVNLHINLYQRKKGETLNHLFEYINGYESIKGIHLQDKIEEKYRTENLKLLEKTNQITKLNIKIDLLAEIIENMGYLFIIYYASIHIMKNTFTIPMLFTSINLYQYFITPMKSFLLELSLFKEALASYQRIISLFVKKKTKGFLSDKIEGKIEIKNLDFSYVENYSLIQNISFQIEKGEKVLLLGKSGVGKSTFLKLLKRYYEIEKGSILIDEIDIKNYTEKQLEADISYISQHETLFTGSLYENIVYKERERGKHLQEIINICELDPILKKDPLGVYQLIEEGGYHLSGGEKQRIVLARCLMKSFSILLIDEGFSELDIKLERKLIKKLFAVYLKNTIIIVSHRMDNIDLYDKIIHFHKEKIHVFKKGPNGNYHMV